MNQIYHSILGLPRSGKTTYLAALWHLIDAGEVESSFVLAKLVGDNEYLNAIVKDWRSCKEVPRTSRAAETTISIHVRDVATGNEVVLEFPDLSGESFQDQFVSRTCTQDYVDGLKRDGGLMVFINADRPTEGISITELGAELNDSNDCDVELVDWKHEHVPEQVRVVDLLQFLKMHPFLPFRRKIAICISAWDVVGGGVSPEQWLAREMPLLNQFIRNNGQFFFTRIYGISAQGGDVNSSKRDVLLETIPSARIHCAGPEAKPHDITAPLTWLSASN